MNVRIVESVYGEIWFTCQQGVVESNPRKPFKIKDDAHNKVSPLILQVALNNILLNIRYLSVVGISSLLINFKLL